MYNYLFDYILLQYWIINKYILIDLLFFQAHKILLLVGMLRFFQFCGQTILLVGKVMFYFINLYNYYKLGSQKKIWYKKYIVEFG